MLVLLRFLNNCKVWFVMIVLLFFIFGRGLFSALMIRVLFLHVEVSEIIPFVVLDEVDKAIVNVAGIQPIAEPICGFHLGNLLLAAEVILLKEVVKLARFKFTFRWHCSWLSILYTSIIVFFYISSFILTIVFALLIRLGICSCLLFIII